MFRRAWTHPKAHWVSLVVAAIGLGAVRVWVDLSPKVESDFFFSADDPQLQVSNELNQRYGGGGEELVVVRAEDTAGDPEVYRERIGELPEAFLEMEAVTTIFSEFLARSASCSNCLAIAFNIFSNLIYKIFC